jgi:hypothetical protein
LFERFDKRYRGAELTSGVTAEQFMRLRLKENFHQFTISDSTRRRKW